MLEKEIKDTLIATDSLSVLQTLLKDGLHNIAHPTIASIRQKIYAIFNRGYKLQLVWVPSHVGIIGNEIADDQAKKACPRNVIDSPLIVKSDWYNTYKARRKSEYFEQLCSYGKPNCLKGDNYMSCFRTFSESPWFNEYNLTKKEIVYINRIRSGHYQLNAHLYRMHIVNSPNCDCGDISQSIDHIVWFCPLYDNGEQKCVTFCLKIKSLFIPVSRTFFWNTLFAFSEEF